MKKKWIVAFIAAGVLLLGGVTVYAVKTSSQSTVKVVSVSDMSGGGGWSDNSLSGNITSDVSQNIYLADSQTVKKIHVKEGDTVKVGDDLLTYDMTLENLDLEMKKLEKQGIELNIEKANREITKLKNTKPSSDNGNEDPGLDIPEDPGEEPEDPSIEPEEPAEAYQELTAEAEPYMGEGTNVVYRKSLFFGHKGFSRTLNLRYGDDDLFINEVATPQNTRVEISPESRVDVCTDDFISLWRMSKLRYCFTAPYLRHSRRYLFAFEQLSVYLFYVALVAMSVIQPSYPAVWGADMATNAT